MQKIAPDLHSIAAPFPAILLDAYGVFWAGGSQGLLPGSEKAMRSLVDEGKRVGILSNSTQLVEKEIEKLSKHNLLLNTHYHFLLTSGEIARSLFLSQKLPFQTPRNTYWLFSDGHPVFSSHKALFQNTPYHASSTPEEADFIYIATPHKNGIDQIDPDEFRSEVETLLPLRLPMLCANPDLFAHEGSPPRPVVRQGSIARLYSEMGGEVYFIGKPDKIAFDAALHQFSEFLPSQILMVGDTPETDIRGAKQSGLASALITQTGIFAERLQHQSTLLPSETPDFLIEKLGR